MSKLTKEANLDQYNSVSSHFFTFLLLLSKVNFHPNYSLQREEWPYEIRISSSQFLTCACKL